MSKADDYINILNLGENFKNLSREEQLQALAKTWRKFSLKWHPDRNKSSKAEEIFKQGNNANEKLKEYIKSGYFSDEETENNADDNYSTDDAYNDSDTENYYRTETEYSRDINSQFWEKYSNPQEKKMFFESATPVKIIITAFIISFAWFVVTEFKTTENTHQPKQETTNTDEPKNNELSIKDRNNTQRISSNSERSTGSEAKNKLDYKGSGKDNLDNKSNTTSNEPDFGPYMQELIKRIKANWNPPKSNETKKVEILFTVSKTGQLLKCQIHKSSGIPSVDQAAIDAVKLTAPFKPLPAEYSKPSIDIMFTFDYNVFHNVPATRY